MEAQVQNAVEVALDPAAEYGLKQQVCSAYSLFPLSYTADFLEALEFIGHVKDSPDAWHLALALLTSQPTR